MSALTLKDAEIIVDAALVHRRAREFKPLSVVVLDASGNTIVLKREDRTSLLRSSIAIAKAWGTLGMGCGSRQLERRAKAKPGFYAAITEIAQGRMVPVAGGVLIRDGSGDIIGAAGASGDNSDNDEACLVEGIKAAGLTPDTGDPT